MPHATTFHCHGQKRILKEHTRTLVSGLRLLACFYFCAVLRFKFHFPVFVITMPRIVSARAVWRPERRTIFEYTLHCICFAPFQVSTLVGMARILSTVTRNLFFLHYVLLSLHFVLFLHSQATYIRTQYCCSSMPFNIPEYGNTSAEHSGNSFQLQHELLQMQRHGHWENNGTSGKKVILVLLPLLWLKEGNKDGSSNFRGVYRARLYVSIDSCIEFN